MSGFALKRLTIAHQTHRIQQQGDYDGRETAPASSPEWERRKNASNQRMTSAAPMSADPNYLKGSKRLIPARREAGRLRLHELQLVLHLGKIIAGLGQLGAG